MNSITLIGNLCADVEITEISNGTKVAHFNLAVTRKFDKDKKADFFRIVVWRELAETCAKYLSKGKKAMIQGRLEPREYEKDGVTKVVIEIVANEVEFLTPKSSDGEQTDKPAPKQKPKLEAFDNENDSPF